MQKDRERERERDFEKRRTGKNGRNSDTQLQRKTN